MSERRAPAHSRISTEEWGELDRMATVLSNKPRDDWDDHDNDIMACLDILARLDQPADGCIVGKLVVHPSAPITPELLVYGLLERIRDGSVTGVLIATCGEEDDRTVGHDPSWFVPQLGWVSSLADIVKESVMQEMTK